MNDWFEPHPVPDDNASFDQLLEELSRTRKICQALDESIENSFDGIFITDENCVAIRINPAYERISGLRREDLLGRSNEILVQQKIISASCAAIVIREKKPITMEQQFLTTGKKALNTCTPIFQADGKLIMTVSNIRDLSELNDIRVKLYQEQALSSQYKEELNLMRERLLGNQQPVAVDQKMVEVLQLAQKVARTDVPTLILGETGTGKDEIAKWVHRSSRRRDEPFIEINCAAIPPSLVESELFGYEKGAFTGARSTGKAGLLQTADKGTVFLDEIGDLPLDVQAKLLQFLQSGSFLRVGGNSMISVDVRIVAATNRDLREMVEKKTFRDDLYYRLNVVQIQIPPLRDRPGDILPLSTHFLDEFNQKYNVSRYFSSAVYNCFMNYSWPGNVRELKNAVEHMVALSEQDQISTSALPPQMTAHLSPDIQQDAPLKEILERIEYDYMKKAYAEHKNVRAAAKKLGMSAGNLSRKMNLYRQKYD